MGRRTTQHPPIPDKPQDVVDREREWALLTDFIGDPSPAMRLGIVSGRRRHGKSYLLQALSESLDGLYITAIREEGRIPALQRFSDVIASHAGLHSGALSLPDWPAVLNSAMNVAARRSAVPLLIIDELPYLLQHSPELPGFLQQLYDDHQRGEGIGARVILCGSAMSVMHELLSGTKPLRGRAVIDLRLGAFDYRASRRFWQIEDLHTALRVHSVLGGAPGYQPIAGNPTPNDGFDSWVSRTMLDPGRAVYSRTETEYLLREDPRITQHTLYYDLLSAVAQGATTPTKIGAALGRQRNAIAHPLDVLESTGYIHREQDILRPRHPVITLVDPVIRFNQLITLPQASAVEQGFADEAWKASTPTFNSKILGPHFEELARTWTRRYAHTVLPGGLPGPVGTTEVPDPAARTKHEVDVIALSLGERPQSPRARIALLGEAKATAARRGVSDLQRLERIRDLLSEQGYDTSGVTLALFSLYGFHADVREVAKQRGDVLLVDLETLYGL
ncbi:ATP-binding protein [Streptomyces sp. MB09-02B]|uniref:AAA family ATPase n=1 Tax=Streptomyces sp. MB09-02B TaxID=3028667 RepID=UPI0029AA5CD7|nr:ATP-binding protein [Streptomyces sp. MB09-02B]MDX3641097.1 ATP-binding protein [Streptomyces sp. MB09-02B]